MTHELQNLVNEAQRVAARENADLFNLLNEIELLASKHNLLPTPEKPKRRKGWCLPCNSIEVLPGDPPDWDAFLEAADEVLKHDLPAMDRLRAARHGEGGDE